MRKPILIRWLVILLLLALPVGALLAQEGNTARVLNPPITTVDFNEAGPATAFWNLLLKEDLPPERDINPVGQEADGPYVNEEVFNAENYTYTVDFCGFTPDAGLGPLITLPDSTRVNTPEALSRVGLWVEGTALPPESNNAGCVTLVQQLGIGSFIEAEYSVSFFDPQWGEYTYRWTLETPRFTTTVTHPRGVEYDEDTQQSWLLLSFSPDVTLSVGVYQRYDTTEQDDPEAPPLGWYTLVGEAEVATDEYGEAVLVVTLPTPEDPAASVNTDNLTLIVWDPLRGFRGYNYYPVPGIARVRVGEDASMALRQARPADAPELMRLEDNDVVEMVDEVGEQFRVSTFNQLEGWINYNWVMPLFGVETE